MGKQLDRHAATHDEQIAVIQFLEWVGQQKGGQLMYWREWEEEGECPGVAFVCTGEDCKKCGGTGRKMKKYEDYWPLGNVQDLLYEYFKIDPAKLEAERRELLRSLSGG